MTTLARLRRAALALPEVEEGTHFGMVAFAVRGKGFASLTTDGRVQLQLPDDVADAAVAAHPTATGSCAWAVRSGSPCRSRMSPPRTSMR
jgi:hypothetical protein